MDTTITTYKTHADLLTELSRDPEFVRLHRKQQPYHDLARDLYDLRQEQGLTQTQLAERAQTHQSRISKAEAAELDMRLSTIVDIAEALKARVDIRLVSYSEQDEYRPLFREETPITPQARINFNVTFLPGAGVRV